MKNQIGNALLAMFILIIVGALSILIFMGMLSFRLDLAGGQHRITPTSIDTDIWGNYKVYYKTSEYTRDSEEKFYFIDKENLEIKEQMENCIKSKDTIIVYYEKYVGFKGITAPETAPITKIEIIED